MLRTVSRMPVITLTGSAAVRTSSIMPPNCVCAYGTYIVGGALSRTLLYFVLRTTPTISNCALSSGLEPNR